MVRSNFVTEVEIRLRHPGDAAPKGKAVEASKPAATTPPSRTPSREMTEKEAQEYVYSKCAARPTTPGARQFISAALYLGAVMGNLWLNRSLFAGAAERPLAAAVEIFSGWVAGWALGDLGTGTLHMLLDHPGCRNWVPPFSVIATDLQIHHHFPILVCTGHWSIQLNWTIMSGILFTGAALFWVPPSLFALSFVLWTGFATTVAILAHRWAHMPSKDVPLAVRALQAAGILVSKETHKQHHNGVYDSYFCLLSGWWNPVFNVLQPVLGPTEDNKVAATVLLAASFAAPMVFMACTDARSA